MFNERSEQLGVIQEGAMLLLENSCVYDNFTDVKLTHTFEHFLFCAIAKGGVPTEIISKGTLNNQDQHKTYITEWAIQTITSEVKDIRARGGWRE